MPTPEPLPDDIFSPGGHISTDYLSEPAAEVLRESLRLARETRWESLRSPHIFMGLLSVPDASIRRWGDRFGDEGLAKLLERFQELFPGEGESDALLVLNREFMSNNVIRVLREAYTRARENDRNFITPMDLLITLLTARNSIVAECFNNIPDGVTVAKLAEWAVLAEMKE